MFDFRSESKRLVFDEFTIAHPVYMPYLRVYSQSFRTQIDGK